MALPFSVLFFNSVEELKIKQWKVKLFLFIIQQLFITNTTVCDPFTISIATATGKQTLHCKVICFTS